MKQKNTIVLIADDSFIAGKIRRFSSHYLHVLSYDTDDLLSKITEISPDLIMIDRISEKSESTDIIRMVKKENGINNVPVILINPREDGKYREEARDAGADEFLTSPVDETELQVRVNNLIKLRSLDTGRFGRICNIEEEVARRTHVISNALEKTKIASLDMVYRFSHAAEYRDLDSGTHIERVSRYSRAIARSMNCGEEYTENIQWAAPMHDIGKFGVPDTILQKQGKLTDEEEILMRQHTLIGGSILKYSATDFIKLAGEIALNHHEKWDGSGYPHGLKGEEIPLSGRIVALADVFDELTSDKHHRAPFSLEEAMLIIREGSGNHFDPQTVEAFFSIETEIVKEFTFWQFMSEESVSSGPETNLLDLY